MSSDSISAPVSIQPPSALLTTQTNPQTGQPNSAFPLQTDAWLKMQTVVHTALGFPLTTADFTDQYGTFTDEAQVTAAVAILGQIQATAGQYGDPTTLISQIANFQTANTLPDTIYGGAVWLAAQTVLAVQQIQVLLQEGLDDIASEAPEQRLADLKELLTGEGGITSYAQTLQGNITAFQTQTSAFYDTLNSELTGPNSLQTYLNSSGNVLSDAQSVVTADQNEIDSLNSTIHELNKEYIGFTVAASVSPVFLVIPVVGVLLAVADAATFGTMAALVKKKIDDLRSKLSGVEADKQKKTSLVVTLQGFNKATADVETDGQAFLDTIGQMASGWSQFQGQIKTQVGALTVKDVTDWDAFRQRLGFQAAMTGWSNILTAAETFYSAGFITFKPSTSA